MTSARFTCPSCGYQTITDEWDICPVCGWEYDEFQNASPDDDNGPNRVPLRIAQRNFLRHGTAKPGLREPAPNPSESYERDSNWHPLP